MLRDRVASYFIQHPDRWVDGRVLADIGGYAAWRSRVSDCRTDLHMDIVNRTRRERGFTISEYKFTPKSGQLGLPMGQEARL